MIELQGKSKIISEDECLTIYRVGQVTEVDGVPVQGEITNFQLHCNVQPMGGRDLLIVPELDRFKEQYWLFTNEIAKPLIVNDRVVRNSLNYQVQTVETWGSPPNGYQRARIMKIDVGPNANP